MRVLRSGAWVAALVSAGLLQVPRAQTRTSGHVSDRERLIGAWHLVHIESPGPDSQAGAPEPKGMLIYTQDGHVSVQLMYPGAARSLSNEYVRGGYEASFGSFTINERTHTLTHHVLGSVTGDQLVGKDLARRYTLTDDGRLILRSANPEEHWSATWQHY